MGPLFGSAVRFVRHRLMRLVVLQFSRFSVFLSRSRSLPRRTLKKNDGAYTPLFINTLYITWAGCIAFNFFALALLCRSLLFHLFF